MESGSEHILACLSSSPSNGRIIRTAARMAQVFRGTFTALYVKTSDAGAASQEDKRRLRYNQALAEKLGARIETVYGEDVPFQIAEYARLNGVTKIVLGRSSAGRRRLFGRPPLTEQLLAYAPEVDIHIIPDKSADGPYRPKQAAESGKSAAKNALWSLGILAAATLISLPLHTWGFTDANIIMVYILGVVLTSVVTTHPVYALASSVASVLVFNYLFTVPRFSFAAYGTGYPVTFLIMFLTAYITSTLAMRYKARAGQAALTARRTKMLFDANQALSKARGRDEILDTAAERLVGLLGRNTVIYPLEDGLLQEPMLYPATGEMAYDTDAERPAARRALTEDAPGEGDKGGYLYAPLKVNDRKYGVVGLDVRSEMLDGSERDILSSILAECTLALENERNAREKEAAAVLAESEKLRADLLRTISHDLRTPLTTISGNAANLLANEDKFDPETRRAIYGDIYDDAQWLTELVENLLYATRIEEGRMTLNPSAELLSDIVDEAVAHTRRKTRKGAVRVIHSKELLLVRADARLAVQVIVNLIDNAFKYAGENASVTVTDGQCGGMVEVLVTDDGPGVADSEKERVFEKFFCGQAPVADDRRRLGLGLYLCRAIIQAHGGTIEVRDNQPHGAVFRFTLPLEEVTLHE